MTSRGTAAIATRQNRVGTILIAAIGYVVAGTGTATLAAATSSASSVKSWRLASWLLSLAIFAIHFVIERRRQPRRRDVAALVALAVALGAMGVAVLGPIRMHWGEPHHSRLIALSLIAWPVITGVPAFVVAWLAGLALDFARRGAQASRS